MEYEEVYEDYKNLKEKWTQEKKSKEFEGTFESYAAKVKNSYQVFHAFEHNINLIFLLDVMTALGGDCYIYKPKDTLSPLYVVSQFGDAIILPMRVKRTR